MYITRFASNEIFSPSHKIYREVGRAKDLSAPRYVNSVMLRLYLWHDLCNRIFKIEHILPIASPLPALPPPHWKILGAPLYASAPSNALMAWAKTNLPLDCISQNFQKPQLVWRRVCVCVCVSYDLFLNVYRWFSCGSGNKGQSAQVG